MVNIFGTMNWTSVGPFQFQTARLFTTQFLLSPASASAHTVLERGLLAPDGILARHWMRWTIAMLIAFAVSIVFFLIAITKGTTMSPILSNTVGGARTSPNLRRDIVLIYGVVHAIRHAPRTGSSTA